ncbi:rhodanese-like domain-containing protein [Herbivorax sp. ANBcel31]|uniref:sulfurtransferase n=1 Tax=Herbivorax sp. ANBcel31 TaxID=3069754 RepID=UPI0027AF8747|nr:rhodanese-like domain-containing protein [Herbivorax sp. ANBcel31]MDQ2086532.1 rhodanese-like domain-containing protein [Herbivorax sp. ANBcel31]
MKRRMFYVSTVVLLIVSLLFTSFAFASRGENNRGGQKNMRGGAGPIVSTEWLENNMNRGNLVIIDIRSDEEYQAGHIEESINVPYIVPFSAWLTMRDGLLMELPEKEDIFDMIGSCGINKGSHVVLITSLPTPENPYAIGNANRAANTLIYAGVRKVSILDGGFDKWAEEGRVVSTEQPEVTPFEYKSKVNDDMFVTMDYVEDNLGEVILIDARDYEAYTGEIIEPYTGVPGHIPTAKSLPAPKIWNDDWSYKSVNELNEIVESVIGSGNQREEIIVYCGVGGYASCWAFVLTEMLGYRDVKVYDGSAEEWVKYNDTVVVE